MKIPMSAASHLEQRMHHLKWIVRMQRLVCVGLGAATVLRRRGSRQERKKHDGECESINGLPLVFNPTGATRGFTPIPIPIGKAVS